MASVIETVILHTANADEALALAMFVTQMHGVIDTLQSDQYGEWHFLGRMPRGYWHETRAMSDMRVMAAA